MDQQNNPYDNKQTQNSYDQQDAFNQYGQAQNPYGQQDAFNQYGQAQNPYGQQDAFNQYGQAQNPYGQQDAYQQNQFVQQDAYQQNQFAQQNAYNQQNMPYGQAAPMNTGVYSTPGQSNVFAGEQASKTATSSLVCGIVGLFVAGIILGIVAIAQGNKAKQLGYQGGKATAGIVLGIIDIVLVVLFLIVRLSMM